MWPLGLYLRESASKDNQKLYVRVHKKLAQQVARRSSSRFVEVFPCSTMAFFLHQEWCWLCGHSLRTHHCNLAFYGQRVCCHCVQESIALECIYFGLCADTLFADGHDEPDVTTTEDEISDDESSAHSPDEPEEEPSTATLNEQDEPEAEDFPHGLSDASVEEVPGSVNEDIEFEIDADSNEGQQTGEGVSDTTLEMDGVSLGGYDADEEGPACEDGSGDEDDDVGEPATKRPRNM